MEQPSGFCENCGYKLKAHWIFCVKCGINLSEFLPMQCDRCHHVIDDPQPVFCPYCQYQLQEKMLVTPETPVTKPAIKKVEKPVAIKPEMTEFRVTVKTIVNSYKFDNKATTAIANSSSFSIVAVLLLIFSGISIAFIGFVLDLIFIEEASFQVATYLGYGIFQVLILIGLGFFENTILSMIKTKSSNPNFMRLMGSYAPLFIAKDLLILPVIVYISLFRPGGNAGRYLASSMHLNIILVIIVFILLHLIVYTRVIAQTGTLISFLVVVLSFVISFSFVTGYLIPTIDLLTSAVI